MQQRRNCASYRQQLASATERTITRYSSQKSMVVKRSKFGERVSIARNLTVTGRYYIQPLGCICCLLVLGHRRTATRRHYSTNWRPSWRDIRLTTVSRGESFHARDHHEPCTAFPRNFQARPSLSFSIHLYPSSEFPGQAGLLSDPCTATPTSINCPVRARIGTRLGGAACRRSSPDACVGPR